MRCPCGDCQHLRQAWEPPVAIGPSAAIGSTDFTARKPPFGEVLSNDDNVNVRLDRWAIERHKVAADVIAVTDRMTRMATIKSRKGKALGNMAVEFAGHLPPVRAAVARTLAELDTR